MIIITIYGKKGCHLCEEAEDVVAKVGKDYKITIQKIDIEKDKELFARYKEKIPVIAINGEEEFVYKVNEKRLRKKLDTI